MRPVLILDFGSQYTRLIARRVREQNVFCEIHPCTADLGAMKALDPVAVILSGGPASVFADGAPSIDKAVFEWGVPVLGICYGMQLMSHLLGGRVEAAGEREFGPATITVDRSVGLLRPLGDGAESNVWMSHGDRVAAIPSGFETIAHSANSPFAAVADEGRGLYGVQFHPEVAHTTDGEAMLRAFLFDVAGAEASWTAEHFVEQSVGEIRRQVGDDKRVVCGLSGGVDSSVAAMLVA
ncbi:MAG: glutamine-hydrolyzing GMP synthase, partial [Myxococcota bacterium]